MCHQYDLDIPLMDLLRLTKDKILIVNNTKKSLIMQLTKQLAVLFDQENKVISMKGKSFGYLKINGSMIQHNNYESGLLINLLKLKTKHSHIFKNIYRTNDVVLV